MNDVVQRAAANCAGAYLQWVARTGHRCQVWPDLSVGDMGLPNSVPVDSAHLLARPRSQADLHEAVDRVEDFFAGAPGGPVQFWSAWDTGDLMPAGYSRFTVPGMVRSPGAGVAHRPSGLQVAPARSPADFVAASLLIDEVFQCAASNPRSLLTGAVLGEDFEVFLGRVADRVVATATAYVSHGFCGVYAVATEGPSRGKGYGEALSWAATLFRPDLPATLQASRQGQPIYQRMGYRVFGNFTVWQAERRQPRPPGVHAHATVRPQTGRD